MKRTLILLLILCLLLPLISNAEEFSIRKGIMWNMTIEQVKKLMHDEGYEIFERGLIMDELMDYLLYKEVKVAGVMCNMILSFLDYEKAPELPEQYRGLQLIIYYVPGYSLLTAHEMISDYGAFKETLTKKYSEPNANSSWWMNDDYKGLYTKGTGAKMGLYKQTTSWDKKDVYIELWMNDELHELMPEVFNSSPTVWVAYYNKEFYTIMSNHIDESNGGM